MKFFIDSASIDEIEALLPTGLVDGVTTNPSLVAATGRALPDVVANKGLDDFLAARDKTGQRILPAPTVARRRA